MCQEVASTSSSIQDHRGAERITNIDRMGHVRDSAEESSKVNEFEPDPAMKAEIEAAVGFLTDFLVKAPKLAFSQESVDLFRSSLQSLLYRHYNGHWNSANPLKGSGFRCLRINGKLDPLVKVAAEASQLPLRKVRQAFPAELTVWVDPGDVSVRFGEEGSIGVWYASRRAGEEDEKLKEHLASHHHVYHRGSPRSGTPPFQAQQAYQHAAHQRVPYHHGSPVQYQQRDQRPLSPQFHSMPGRHALHQTSSPTCGFVTALSHQQQQMQRVGRPVTPITYRRPTTPTFQSNASPQPHELASSTPPVTETGEEMRCKMLAERLMRENLNLMASLAPGLVSSRAQAVGVGVN